MTVPETGAFWLSPAMGNKGQDVSAIAPTLQAALDDWDRVYPALLDAAAKPANIDIDPTELHSPLPRAYEWIDGSAYINHIVLVRKARNAEPPETLETDPLVYQGGSGVFLRPTQDIPLPNADWGLDYEAEICVVLGDIPQGTKKEDAHKYIRLIMLCNDVSLRNLIPAELKKSFGFFNSKPASAFSPFAVTPDELGDAFKDGRVFLPLHSRLNGSFSGSPDAGPEMHFSFYQLIEHICKTRSFTAGTILGSGTISNVDEAKGVSCLAEARMRETIKDGKPTTEFLKSGDRVEIEMIDAQGRNIFGTIDQKVAG